MLEIVYDERFAPRYGAWRAVVREVADKFLACGILNHAFARVRCDECAHEYLLAFSCKGRSFCPSGHPKRLALWTRWREETRAHARADARGRCGGVPPDARRARELASAPSYARPRRRGSGRRHLRALARARHGGADRSLSSRRAPPLRAARDLRRGRRRGDARLAARRVPRARRGVGARRRWGVRHTARALLRAESGGTQAPAVRRARHAGVPAPVTPVPVASPKVLPLREARRRWAELLRRIYEVDPLACPACGGAMRLLAFITERAVIDRILAHLRRARGDARGPPVPRVSS